VTWDSLISTFALVFIAELGDKTQLAVMAQTCKHRSAGSVFIGGSLALILVSGIGVVGGQVLGQFIPPEVIRIFAGLGFLAMGVLIWRETRKLACESDGADLQCDPDVPEHPRLFDWQAFSSTFALLFLAELGDKTQLAVIGLSSHAVSPWIVFAGSALALTLVTAMGVVGGQQLARLVPQRLLLAISAVLFVGMGVLIATGIL
jgi:putative Ca2+/H+ antiporter (TMEM165/GDT1 family)